MSPESGRIVPGGSILIASESYLSLSRTILAESTTMSDEVKRDVSKEELDCSRNEVKHDCIVESIMIPPDRHGLEHYDVVRPPSQSTEM